MRALAVYQIITVLPSTYNVTLPERYKRWMRGFEWVQLDVDVLLPVSCVGDFYSVLALSGTCECGAQRTPPRACALRKGLCKGTASAWRQGR